MRLASLVVGITLALICRCPLIAAEAKVEAQGVLDVPQLQGTERVGFVVRSPQELADFFETKDLQVAEARVCAALHVEQLDFKKQMLLVASPAPMKGETAARIVIGELKMTDGTLTVPWDVFWFLLNKSEPPPARRACFALVDKQAAPVKFLNPGRHGR